MDIVLDSNIIRSDLKLVDKNFEILLDYLNSTNSKLIMPSIVIEEIHSLYQRAIKDSFESLKSLHYKLNSMPKTFSLEPLPDINYQIEADEYVKSLKAKLNVMEDQIIPYRNEYLPEIVKRAINRSKPLDSKGQQFRDGILWLTMLDYARDNAKKQMIFISNNLRDFGDKERSRNQLDDELVQEAESQGVEFLYYHSLLDFAKQHASTVDFINEGWIESAMDIHKLRALFWEAIDSDLEEEILRSVELGFMENIVGHLDWSEYFDIHLEEFFLYKKSDGTILLDLTYSVEIEAEIEVVRLAEDKYDYYNSLRFGSPTTPYSSSFYDSKYICPQISARYTVTLSNKIPSEYQMENLELISV